MARHLLSVDDDPPILSLIGKVAGDLGFEVDVVTHASFFMAAYVRKKPDVITLDILMPNMDGIELIRWLGDVGCEARVVLLSGATHQYAKMAHRLGEDGSRLNVSRLSKPFPMAALRAALTGDI